MNNSTRVVTWPSMSDSFNYADHPHRRRNPLTGDWVLVSPHRNKRPWQGQTEAPGSAAGFSYDADCYLCPGNQRMGGARNPNYSATYVFPNDFPALLPEGGQHHQEDALFSAMAEQGECRVVAYSPDHSKTLAQLEVTEIAEVIDAWAGQCEELGAVYPWVQLFENKGEVMGCSMPHPHGQVWAQVHPPTLLAKEDQAQSAYFETVQRSLLLDYVERELSLAERCVVVNEDWLVVVPYWAAWPFETLLLPRFAVARLPELTRGQRRSLAAVLSELLSRYDNLFECSFPYSMGWHGAPSNADSTAHWQLHAHFFPPLLRSRSIRKFMVGYEMLAETQRDLTPEQAAALLRDVPARHYLAGAGEQS